MFRFLDPKFVFFVLVIADIAFIQTHRLHHQGVLGEAYSLETESGFAELFLHVKEVLLASLVILLLRRCGDAVYRWWAVLFTYLWLDDTFMIHERVGLWLAQVLGIDAALGLRGQDFGELLVSGTVGIVVLSMLAVNYGRSSREAQDDTIILTALIALLAFFGIVVDMLHMVVSGYWIYRMGIIEDGGEMLTISLMVWYVLTSLRQRTRHAELAVAG